MDIAQRQRPAPGELFLDHVSHFVPDLDAAGALLADLGFAVTPLSVQMAGGNPVGASNRCVMLEAGYIELLTPTHDTPTARRMRERLARFTGVHLACFGTPDAAGEHARLAAHGFDPQPLVDLEREVAGGARARFKVVRPAPESMPEGRIQYVEHLAPEAIWTRESLAHDNGVSSLEAVYVAADDPAAAAARWARFCGALPYAEDGLVLFQTSRGRVFFGTPDFFASWWSAKVPPPAIAGYRLACRHREAFLARCSQRGLEVRACAAGHAVSLPAALGGGWLI